MQKISKVEFTSHVTWDKLKNTIGPEYMAKFQDQDGDGDVSQHGVAACGAASPPAQLKFSRADARLSSEDPAGARAAGPCSAARAKPLCP